MALNGQPTAAFQNGGEAWLTKGGIADTPMASAADGSREHGARLQQRDDFREGIAHAMTDRACAGIETIESVKHSKEIARPNYLPDSRGRAAAKRCATRE
jgi:hypothetical protein